MGSEELLVYGLFIAGFIFLIKGADWLVQGASSIAKYLKISDMAIGLTIVSIGTSMPELVVNIIASFEGSAGIAIGNVLGSNIANVLLILGASALIYPLAVKKSIVFKELPFSVAAAVILLVIVNIEGLWNDLLHQISRLDGAILLLFFAGFLYYVFKTSKEEPGEDEIEIVKPWLSVLLIVMGCVMLMLGGDWIVDGAVHIARQLAISEEFVGLTVVAFGTSLPELATCVLAAYRKNADIAVGNVVGSNIFNILWILGLSAAIKPLPFNLNANVDILVTILASILLFLILFVGKRRVLDSWKGMLFLLIYIAYIFYLLYRG